MKMRTFLSNWLWAKSCSGHHRSFMAALDRVEETQKRYLFRLVRTNADTRFGKYHHFDEISSPEDYRQSVPVSKYEDYLLYLQAVAAGESGVLTTDTVELFQPTSGTISASKLVPYTRTLKAEFQRAIGPWVAHLFDRKPGLLRGSAYWSISPPVRQPGTHGRVRVGFDDDAEYLGFLGKRLFAQVCPVPPDVVTSPDMETFFRRTLLCLIMAEDLALISVWSPTFLLVLLDKLIEYRDEILYQLSASRVDGAPARAKRIKVLMPGQNADFESIWPHLSLISCWADGPSSSYADEIRKRLPHVEIQGKGLVATEAFVSLPLLEGSDPVLAVESHFFEFRDVVTGAIRFSHELTHGRTYSVIVTTGGGLYRYALGDLVQVTGFIGQAPALRFVCREEVSDLAGEKLNSEHVRRSAVAAFAECPVNPKFYLVTPVAGSAGSLSYCLFIDAPGITDEVSAQLRTRLEEGLFSNFHYRLCRDTHQLGPLRVFLIDRSSLTPEDAYNLEMQRRGLKLGNIKQAVLDKMPGWEQRFHGRFV